MGASCGQVVGPSRPYVSDQFGHHQQHLFRLRPAIRGHHHASSEALDTPPRPSAPIESPYPRTGMWQGSGQLVSLSGGIPAGATGSLGIRRGKAARGQLDDTADVAGPYARGIEGEVEDDPLAREQRALPSAMNCGLVHDGVSPSAVRHDAAFTPFRVEPLHDSHRHASTPA